MFGSGAGLQVTAGSDPQRRLCEINVSALINRYRVRLTVPQQLVSVTLPPPHVARLGSLRLYIDDCCVRRHGGVIFPHLLCFSETGTLGWFAVPPLG